MTTRALFFAFTVEQQKYSTIVNGRNRNKNVRLEKTKPQHSNLLVTAGNSFTGYIEFASSGNAENAFYIISNSDRKFNSFSDALDSSSDIIFPSSEEYHEDLHAAIDLCK